MDDVEIREVEREDAEAVLIVRLFVPGVTGGGEDRHYLTRRRPIESVVESVTHNPDGSVSTTRTCNRAPLVTTVVYADGCTIDGRGFGYGKAVFIKGRSADVVAVQVSMDWTARDGARGHLDEELVVPWLGAARADLSGGGWVAAEITPIGDSA